MLCSDLLVELEKPDIFRITSVLPPAQVRLSWYFYCDGILELIDSSVKLWRKNIICSWRRLRSLFGRFSRDSWFGGGVLRVGFMEGWVGCKGFGRVGRVFVSFLFIFLLHLLLEANENRIPKIGVSLSSKWACTLAQAALMIARRYWKGMLRLWSFWTTCWIRLVKSQLEKR